MTPARIARRALPVAVAAAALTALAVTCARYDARDRDRALLIAETARFGPGTRGRVAPFIAATRPGATLAWRARDPGWLDDTVTVELTLTGAGPTTHHTFTVHLATRDITPADPDTAALITRIATWAAEK